METCPSAPLRNMNALLDNQKEKQCEEKTCVVDITTSDIEIIKENVNNKIENQIDTTSAADVKQVKKIKPKIIRGEKRKYSDKPESAKKVKRNKKEEKPIINLDSPSHPPIDPNPSEGNEETKIPSPAPTQSENEEVKLETNLETENQEVQVKQKSKQMSARKSKAITKSCRETLDTLLKFGLETLDSIDRSLNLLKSHNILGSKLVPVDTLIELVSLALETAKANDLVDTEKEMNFSKIVSKLTLDAGSSPKVSKAKRNIAVGMESPMAKPVVSEEVPMVISDVTKDESEKLNSTVEMLEEKSEEHETTVDMQEKNQEPAVEKFKKNLCITNYFKKLKRTVDERDKNERFSSFTAKTDMTIAPKLGGELIGERRENFEKDFTNQNAEVSYLVECKSKRHMVRNHKKLEKDMLNTTDPVSEKLNKRAEVVVISSEAPVHCNEKSESGENSEPRKRVALVRVDQPKFLPAQSVCKAKAKLLQFHDNRRPPYWGTWRRKSETVKARNPLGRDKLLNYEVDSDDEWESEEEPGESLHGSDDEKEPEEDYEVDNDFFVPHGYLSDDENPEKENMSPKSKLDLLEEQFNSEQKQKTRKMMPLVFGTYWVHKESSTEGSLFQDLQIENLQIIPWTTLPIHIDEEDDKKNETTSEQSETTSQSKKFRQKTFPTEEIPNLIKMIHGSQQNSEFLAKKFLLYWDEERVQDGKRPALTKICVLKKIKELASWQSSQEKGKCWLVPKETRVEFGADTEVETPTKKPKKCFIWKFVRRAERTPGSGSPTPHPEPEVVVLES